MKKYLLAQTIIELNYILKNFKKKEIVCIPLNLEQLLYCKKNKINFININNFLSNEVHKKCLLTSNDIIKNLKFDNYFEQNIKLEFIGILRFRINLLIFILELLHNINNRIKIKTIVLSGWTEKNPINLNCYFLHRFRNVLESKYKVVSLKKKVIKNSKSSIDFKFISQNIIDNSKINILMNNGGYNFKRFFLSNIKRNYSYYFFSSKKINFLKRIILYFLNSHPIYYKNIKSQKKIINIFFKLRYKKNLLIEESLINIMKDYNLYFNSLLNFQEKITKFLSDYKFSLVISNICKGLEGSFIQEAQKKNIATLCVPHGTIAKHFNKYDKIYKKTIAEAVFSGKSSYFALQSKIFNDALRTHKINGKTINSGNLIFAENHSKSIFKKKYILYAVTLKNLYNFQAHGVEFFYEFYNNLESLDKLALIHKLNIMVNIHPSHRHLKKDLQKKFNNLIFKCENIATLLKKSYATISFSSTVIEDSLNSKIPVILFDPWKRYQHCEIKTKNSNTSCLYYINSYEKLISCINLIKRNKLNFKYDFKKYIFLKKSYLNINKIIKYILNKVAQ